MKVMTCPIHKATLVIVFDHIKKRTYHYCQMCRPGGQMDR